MVGVLCGVSECTSVEERHRDRYIYVHIPVAILQRALPRCLVVNPISHELVSVDVVQLAAAAFLARLPLSHVLVPVCVGEGAGAVCEVVGPLALVALAVAIVIREG